MRARLIRFLALALLLPAAAQAAFLEYGSPAYQALQTASQRAGTGDWVAQRLQKNQPITEFVAREEANALMQSKRLEPQYIKALKDAFPPETLKVEEKYVKLDADLQKLEDKIALVGAKLDKFEAGMRDGLLSGRSRPSMLGSMSADLASVQNWHGPGAGHIAERAAGGSGIWTEWTLGGDGFNLTWVMEFYSGYIDFTSAHLGFFFDNAIMPGIEVVIADENNYPALSTLVFSGGGVLVDDFIDVTHLSGRKDLIKSSPGYGARGGQDIYVRRKGPGDWWPFSDTQFVATQTYNYPFGIYGGHYLNEIAANVKLRGLPSLWIFERTDPALTYVWSFNDQADLNGQKSKAPSDNATSEAIAITSQLAGGGTLYLEFAAAQWQEADIVKDYSDFAYLMTLSKSIGKTAVVIDYQHTGPDYFAGTANEPSGNAATSLFYTSDPRPGRSAEPGWATVAWEPTYPSTNTEHASIGAQTDLGFGSLSLTLGSNMEITQSGPWIETAHIIGWPWSRYKDNNGSHGFEDHRVNVADYNGYPASPAIYKGQTMNVNWAQLRGGNLEEIILSKNGVGDNELRDDSVKYVNFIDLRGDLNFQSIFDMKRPCLLKAASRLRNTEESFSIPTISDHSLLMQIASSLTFNAELPGRMQMVVAIGYEDWLSKASFRPIEYHTNWVFFQYWKDFPEFLSGFSVGPTLALMNNLDSNYDQRNFSAWKLGIGASTSF